MELTPARKRDRWRPVHHQASKGQPLSDSPGLGKPLVSLPSPVSEPSPEPTEASERRPEDMAVFHSRASQWFEAEGLVGEAIQHALDGGDIIAAARLVEQNRQSMLNTNGWFFFEKWLPNSRIALFKSGPSSCWHRPGFTIIIRICAHATDSRCLPSLYWETIRKNSRSMERLISSRGSSLHAGGWPKRLKYIEDALDRIPEAHHMVRGFAEMYFGLAGQMQGQETRVVDGCPIC